MVVKVNTVAATLLMGRPFVLKAQEALALHPHQGLKLSTAPKMFTSLPVDICFFVIGYAYNFVRLILSSLPVGNANVPLDATSSVEERISIHHSSVYGVLVGSLACLLLSATPAFVPGALALFDYSSAKRTEDMVLVAERTTKNVQISLLTARVHELEATIVQQIAERDTERTAHKVGTASRRIVLDALKATISVRTRYP
jgi:hypothetical protein